MNKSERHMFVIPTHRKCHKAVDSMLLEMKSFDKAGTENFLVIIDNSIDSIFKINDQFLTKRVSKLFWHNITRL